MRLERSWTLPAVVVGFLVAAVAADDGPPAAGGKPNSAAPAEADTREVPCSSVATAWPVTGSGPYTLEAPQLAVTVTDIRPKDGMVFLDGRFAGRARYFNGMKGFLYLEPGDYRLELRLDGYRTEAFQIAARPSCRFEIRHRMQKSRGPAAEETLPPVGKGEPEQWIWAPVASEAAAPSGPAKPAGPDATLRPDLDLGPSTAAEVGVPRGSLRLRVKPPTAEVYLDGSFLATGRELELMVAPLAVPAGRHVLEVRAPGFASRSEEISAAAGDVVEVEIVLQRGPG
jgi:hypothetical protein